MVHTYYAHMHTTHTKSSSKKEKLEHDGTLATIIKLHAY